MEPGQVEKEDNLSLVLHGVKDIRLESVPIKEPKEDEVRLSNMYCGMCCTDVHLWKEGSLGEGLIQVKNPIVLGHEGCGIVEKVGSNVRNVKVAFLNLLMEPEREKKPDNLSLVLHGVGDVRLESLILKDPLEGEVRLVSKYNGICCTDIHFWKTGVIGDGTLKLEDPIILGHEGCGVVEKVGSNVSNVAVGDRVVVEVVAGCGQCSLCQEGRYNICPDFTLVGIPPYRDGMLTRYPIVPAGSIHKLPDNVSFEEGALMEPLSVVVHACLRANIRLGDTVLVLGAGPIGLMSLQTAKAMGADRVGIADLCPDRLELAKKLGADFVVHVTPGENERLLAGRVVDVIGKKCDVTLECAGVAACVRLGISVTRRGGVVMILGIGDDPVEIPLFEATLNEIDIKGSMSTRKSFPLAIQLVSCGKVDVKSLITHRYTLEQCLEAFNLVKDGGDGLIKCVIQS